MNNAIFKKGEILGKITHTYPDGMVDVDYDGTTLTLPANENEMGKNIFADGDEIKEQRISQIREQKIARIKAFLSHWPDDAKTWDKATDEVPDLHNAIAEYFEEDGYKGHIFVSSGGTLPDDVRELPSKRNTVHKKAIYDLLDKMSDKDFEKFYNDYKGMFEQYGQGGATPQQLKDLEELAKVGILGRAYDEFIKAGIKVGDTFKSKEDDDDDNDFIVTIEEIDYKTQHVWVVYATAENRWIPETEGEGRTFREVLEYINKGLWVKTEKTYRRGGPIARSFVYSHNPVEKWTVEYEWNGDFPVIISIHVTEKTSSQNGERLSEFKAGDVVYRNYGRYEEYEIINDKKDIWVLQDTRTGATSKWNANNNGGFILKTAPTVIDVDTLSEEDHSKILNAAHTDHMERQMEQAEARHNEFARGGPITNRSFKYEQDGVKWDVEYEWDRDYPIISTIKDLTTGEEIDVDMLTDDKVGKISEAAYQDYIEMQIGMAEYNRGEAKNGASISETDSEKYGTVFKEEWDKYNSEYKDKIKYATYEIPDKVAVFEGKEQMSVPFFKMYGTTNHIKNAFDFIESRKAIAHTITDVGDAEKYPELVKPHNFEVIAITQDSYADGYRAYEDGGLMAAYGTTIHDIKEFYQPGKFYRHKRLGYITKYIGKGPRGKHTYYIVDTAGVQEFQVGDQFTPNEPQKWFDIVDEQTTLQFKANGGPVREDFIKIDNGTVFYIDKVPDQALDKRGKMSEHEAMKQGINLVFLKNFENDPDALDIAATEMEDTKQPSEAQVRRAMILKIGYEGFWYALKAGGESGSDHLYSSSLSMDMEGPNGEDVEKVLIKKYNTDFKKILITEDEIRDIKDKIIKFRKRGKKIRDEKVRSIMQFLIKAQARGKYDVTGGKQKDYTEQFKERIINMILEITDNENVIREEVHFRVKQHQDELDWMGDKECLYMLDDKYMTPERCKEETQKAKDKARKYIVIWKKLESDLISRMSHEQAAGDGSEIDPSIPVMDEETYLAVHGASRQDIGDSALHKNRGGASDKVWTKIVDAQAKKDTDLLKRRQKLREEYWVKVGQGELRPPTRIEKLIETAQGHSDNESVQAARRLLEKKGISWEKMAKDGATISAETTANNWWRHTLSMNQQNAFAKKYLQSYEVSALIGSTAQFASADYHYKLITKIWRREGSPAYSEWLEQKYGYGDLTDSDLGMKIYYKTHPEYTGFKEKFTSSHAFNDWASGKAKDGLLKNFDINDLDDFERRQYDDFIKHSSKEEALQILINNVEGDHSQLSPKLAEIAELQEGKAADGKSLKKEPLVNYANKSITFPSIEEAKQAKKKLKDFDFSLIWEHGDGDWKEGMPNNMITDRLMLFGNDVDFRISLNLLNLEYRDVSEYEWIFKTAWESTPNGVPFTDNIHGPHGSAFVVFPLPFHDDDDINRAKAWIRHQRDVVSLKVAGDAEWDDLYKSAYFRDPRTRPLKWYQIEQDDKLIRKERKKGTTPTEFVDKFVLPHIGRTEDEMRKTHGEKIYQMTNGGVAAKGKKISEDPLIKEVEKDGIVSGRFGDAKLSSVVYQYGMKMYQVVTDHTKGDEKTIIDVTPDDMGEEAEGDFFYDNGGIAARGKKIQKAGGGTKESEWKKKDGVWTHPLYNNTSLIQRGTPELPFSGIHSSEYATKMPDGMEMGWDADMGDLVAYKNRLISIVDLPKDVKVIPFKKLKAKADDGLEMDESYYIVRMWDTDEDKRKGVTPEEKKYKTRSEAVSQANHSYHEDNFGIVEVEDENSNRILTLDAYAKNGTEIDNIYKEAKKRYRSTLKNLTDDYEVELAAEPNPDYDRDSHEGTIRIKKHRVKVTSLEEARDKVVQFIQNNDLGSGNWSGGDLYQNGKKVGYVSYNGRVWNNDGTPKKDCHGTPMASQGTAVAAVAPNLTSVIGFEEFSNKLPDIESPFVGEEGVIYKAKYDTYAGKMMYFKHGRRGLHSTSVAGAYIHHLYDKYGIRFKDLSLEERKQLFGKFANRYRLEMFEEGGPVLVD